MLETIREGTELTIQGPDTEAEGQIWRSVLAADGTAGWMVAEALEPIAPPDVSPTAATLAPSPSPSSPAPSATPSPTATLSPSPTATPSPSATAAPTPAPTATPAPSPVPAAMSSPSRAPDATVTPVRVVVGSAAPCRPGQIKGDAATGLYHRPPQPEYGVIRERVRCFDGEAQARASGYQPAP